MAPQPSLCGRAVLKVCSREGIILPGENFAVKQGGENFLAKFWPRGPLEVPVHKAVTRTFACSWRA